MNWQDLLKEKENWRRPSGFLYSLPSRKLRKKILQNHQIQFPSTRKQQASREWDVSLQAIPQNVIEQNAKMRQDM